MIDAGGRVGRVGFALKTVDDHWNPGRRNRLPTVKQPLRFTPKAGPNGVAHGRWSRDYRWNERVIRVFHKPRKSDLCVEFIIGPRTILRIQEGIFSVLLRTQDVIHECSDSVFIKAGFRLNAELHQLHRGIVDRTGNVCERKRYDGLIQNGRQ
jgi:hypothetical protein